MSTVYATLLNQWGLQFAGVDDSALIEGSPERTAARVVVRDVNGQRWILEQIDPANQARKREISETLHSLVSAGLAPLHPWRTNESGSLYAINNGHSWMLRSYVDGVPLDRDRWLDDSWRMDAMADFLIRMRACSNGNECKTFSIAGYAATRMQAWRAQHPVQAAGLDASFSSLQRRFFPIHDQLPVAFCHGDFHPLNVIWGAKEMRSVIDWEFCGLKPELYDAALLLGCRGFDNPDALLGGPTVQLVKMLRSAGFGSPASWEWILELTATIRYGWMSEWIRRGEEEAMEMERVYIDILVDQKDYILQRWR